MARQDTALTLLPVLQAQATGMTGKEAGQLRSTIVQAAQRLNDVQWGGAPYGEISGMTVRIPHHRLWINPLCAVEYSQEDVQEMADSLRINGQLQPLVVAPGRPSDGSGGDYLVLDGALRLRAISFAGHPALEDLDCIIHVHPHAYAATLEAVTMKASQHPLSEEQAGSLLRRLKAVYGKTKRVIHDLEPWPTQMEWARIFGRSQTTVSRWLAIADMDQEVQQAIEDGRVSGRSAAEFGPLSQAEQRVVIAELDSGRQREGQTTIPREAVRRAVQARRRGPVLWVDSTPPVPATELLLNGLSEYETPVAIGIVAHDLGKLLDAAMADLSNPHPALARLQKALAAPEIAAFVAQVCATFE